MSTQATAGVPPEAPDAVLVNGQVLHAGETHHAAISVLERGLHYGDGLFETIACQRGRPRLLDFHLERLALGCERLRIAFNPFSELKREIEGLAGGQSSTLLKVIVTRGPATARGYGARGDEHATRITLRFPWPQEDSRCIEDGVAVRVAELKLGENPLLAGLKHLNRLEQVLARGEWRDPQIFDALLFSSSGLLVSGTMCNVFIVQEKRLLTPRLDLCGVAGVMRRAVLRAAAGSGIAAAETALGHAELDAADEIFLTNARIGVWPVRAVGARTLVPGPMTRRVQKLIESLLEGPADA
ncbi:MAG TPA: aminodeoxychorismate lyase [Steroidobacteraceae bacterium]|nr:aminodeoxychorismate lyase [Steroidobacteraceae bacterium]